MNSRVRGFLGKMANIALIVLGFVLVFFTTSSKSGMTQSHESLFGTEIVHADAPVSSSCTGAYGGSGGGVYGGGGSGGSASAASACGGSDGSGCY